MQHVLTLSVLRVESYVGGPLGLARVDSSNTTTCTASCLGCFSGVVVASGGPESTTPAFRLNSIGKHLFSRYPSSVEGVWSHRGR